MGERVQIQGFIHEGGESLSLLKQLREAVSLWLSPQKGVDPESLRTWAVGGGILGGFLFSLNVLGKALCYRPGGVCWLDVTYTGLGC